MTPFDDDSHFTMGAIKEDSHFTMGAIKEEPTLGKGVKLFLCLYKGDREHVVCRLSVSLISPQAGNQS